MSFEPEKIDYIQNVILREGGSRAGNLSPKGEEWPRQSDPTTHQTNWVALVAKRQFFPRPGETSHLIQTLQGGACRIQFNLNKEKGVETSSGETRSPVQVAAPPQQVAKRTSKRLLAGLNCHFVPDGALANRCSTQDKGAHPTKTAASTNLLDGAEKKVSPGGRDLNQGRGPERSPINTPGGEVRLLFQKEPACPGPPRDNLSGAGRKERRRRAPGSSLRAYPLS